MIDQRPLSGSCTAAPACTTNDRLGPEVTFYPIGRDPFDALLHSERLLLAHFVCKSLILQDGIVRGDRLETA